MNEPLIDWIRKSPPAWSNNIIQSMEQDYPDRSNPGIRQFVYLTEDKYRDIDPNTIIGQWEHYAGQKWIDAIFNPHLNEFKIKNCLRLADSNPNYYFNDIKDIHLTSFNGQQWYSNSSGNHRTVIGKFITARAEESTGIKHNFLGVSTTQYHVDWECLELYQTLTQLIQTQNIKISLDAHAEPTKVLSNEFEIKIFVHDTRKGINAARYGWLSAREFCKYARWVIAHNGKFPRSYMVKDLLGWFEQRQLIYPSMSGQYLPPPTRIFR